MLLQANLAANTRKLEAEVFAQKRFQEMTLRVPQPALLCSLMTCVFLSGLPCDFPAFFCRGLMRWRRSRCVSVQMEGWKGWAEVWVQALERCAPLTPQPRCNRLHRHCNQRQRRRLILPQNGTQRLKLEYQLCTTPNQLHKTRPQTRFTPIAQV